MNSISFKKSDWILVRNFALLALLIVAIFGFKINQKLNKINWQELKQNEIKEKEVLSCLNYLEKISTDKSATHMSKYLLLKKGSSCLKQLSFIPEEIVPHQKIFQLEKELDAKEIKEIDYETRNEIVDNKVDIAVYFFGKTRASMIGITLFQSLILGLLAWIFWLWVWYIFIER